MVAFGISEAILNSFIVLGLVLLNSFFVAVEFSIVKVRSSRMKELVKSGSRQAKLVESVTGNLDAYLSACQFGITLASLGLGWVGEPTVAKMIKPIFDNFGSSEFIHTVSFVIAFSIITILHIVLGELAPKTVAIQKAETVALWLALPLKIFYQITYPAIWVLNHLSNFIVSIIGLKPTTDIDEAHSEEEIRILVNESHKSGLINKTESLLFENVFEFADRVAREAMLPRTSAIILDVDDTYENNLKIITETRHTRYPVFEGDKDNIIGFIHVTDFYAEQINHENKTIRNFLREILKVSESMELSDVLRLMQRERTLIAIVVDEFGGTAGIITLEDMIEEIVGEIQDEFDNERPLIEELEDGYSVDGLILVDDIGNVLGIEIPNDEVDTLAGWVHMLLKDVPEIGKSIEYDQHRFEITEMEKNRISRILIKNISSQ